LKPSYSTVLDEGADAIDGDLDFIFALQREGVRRNDAGAGEQKTAEGKAVVAERYSTSVAGSRFSSANAVIPENVI